MDAGIEAVVLQSIVDEWEQLGQRSFLKEWPDPWRMPPDPSPGSVIAMLQLINGVIPLAIGLLLLVGVINLLGILPIRGG